MKNFMYHGPVSSVTIGNQNHLLHPGKTYSLPEDNEYVATLAAQKILVPVPVAPVASASVKSENPPAKAVKSSG